MRNFAIMLLLFTFDFAANAGDGVVVKILPDKLILPIGCEAMADLKLLHQSKPQSQKFSIGYLCKGSDQGMYFLDFRLNNTDIVADIKRGLTDFTVNESQFNSYTLYEVSGKGTKGTLVKSAHYCTKDVCLDLVGDYETSIKASITSQLKG